MDVGRFLGVGGVGRFKRGEGMRRKKEALYNRRTVSAGLFEKTYF